VLQAVEIVGEPEQQGLTTLREQEATRGAAGELAFSNGEDGLDQCASTVEAAWKVVAHLRTYPVDAPSLLAAFGRDDAAGSEPLADVRVVEFGIELGVCQHQTDGADAVRGVDQGPQVGAVIGGTGVGFLREYELPVQIDHDQPLQPVAPWHRLLVVMVHAAHEEGADRAGTESGAIDRYVGATMRAGKRDAMYHLVERACDGGFVEPAQESVQGRKVGNGSELQSVTQFGMFGQPDFGFAIGPVLIAHEAQDGQQLRLRELVFAERRTVARNRGPSDVQGDTCESHQANLGHIDCGFSPSCGEHNSTGLKADPRGT
jgi:hypothetical protein